MHRGPLRLLILCREQQLLFFLVCSRVKHKMIVFPGSYVCISFEKTSRHSSIHIHFLEVKLFIALFNRNKETVVKETMTD